MSQKVRPIRVRIAADARQRLERERGVKVVSNENFLGLKGSEVAKELPE